MGPNTPPVNGKSAQPPANNSVNGAPVNGKHHPTEQAPRPSGPPKPIQDPRVARGQEDQNDSHVPGSPQPEENKPVEKRLNGSPPDGSRLGNKTPGSNGTNGNGNGSGHRSSLFRPGAFASMPILRIPPSEDAPTGRPAMQIPMDVYVRPDGEGAPRANSPARDEKPQVVVPSLDQVLQQNPNLPTQAAVLGVCEDGLPVLLDMDDPTPGALVVIGDEREAQLEVLRTAIASLVKRSSPRSVQFLVFSCEPETWQDWISAQGYDRYSLGVERAESESIRDWVIRLADWTEQRRLGQSSGPSVLLVMDTLSFLTTLDYDIRLNFEWMAKEGPQAHVWPLAVVSTDLAKTLRGRRLLRAFQTQVLGYAHNTEDYVPLAGLDPKEAGAFRARGEFAVKAGENWLRFRLPRR